MGRLGTRDAAEATRVADAIAAAPHLELAGPMTHFATADEPGDDFMPEQLARFAAWAGPLRERHPGLVLHTANSAATLRDPATHFDLVRTGVAMYGLDPFQHDPADHGLEPALELHSYVAEVKPIAPGESAGYGRRFVAEEPTTLATVPIGYGDGVRRALTNNADVLVGGRRRPLRGTVSMDNVTVELVAGEPEAGRGDEAVLIGGQGGERILAEELARRLDTINYEITVRPQPARPPRVPPRRGAGRVIETVREALGDERAWVVGGAVRDRLLGRADADEDVDLVVAGRSAPGRAAHRARGGRGGVRAVGRVRRLARGRPRPGVAGRRHPAPGRVARGRPRRARPDRQRDGRAALGRGARGPARRARGPRRAAAADGVARGVRRRPAAHPAGRAARVRARLRGRPGDGGGGAGARGGPRTRLARAGLRGAQADRRRRRGARRARADGRARPHGGRAAGARRAARRRARTRYHHRDVHGHTLEVLGADHRARARPGRDARRRPRAGGPGAARRAARRRAHPRRRPALRRPAARRRKAADAGRAAGRADRLPRPRRARAPRSPATSSHGCARASACARTSRR